MSKLDVRTHLIVLIFATFLWLFLQGNTSIHLLLILCSCYLSYQGKYRQTLNFIMTYVILVILARLCAPYMAIMYIILNTFARAVPLMMIAATILNTNPSRLMGTYQRLHIPKPVLVMICILIRFFPVIRSEMLYIRDGIRARGLFPHWFDILKHPVIAYECFFVPLIVRCLKLSSELGASAELRGLESTCMRSSIYEIGFKPCDIIVCILFIVCGAGIYLNKSIYMIIFDILYSSQ